MADIRAFRLSKREEGMKCHGDHMDMRWVKFSIPPLHVDHRIETSLKSCKSKNTIRLGRNFTARRFYLKIRKRLTYTSYYTQIYRMRPPIAFSSASPNSTPLEYLTPISFTPI